MSLTKKPRRQSLDVDWKMAFGGKLQICHRRGNGRRCKRRQGWRKVIREAMAREHAEVPYKTRMQILGREILKLVMLVWCSSIELPTRQYLCLEMCIFNLPLFMRSAVKKPGRSQRAYVCQGVSALHFGQIECSTLKPGSHISERIYLPRPPITDTKMINL